MSGSIFTKKTLVVYTYIYIETYRIVGGRASATLVSNPVFPNPKPFASFLPLPPHKSSNGLFGLIQAVPGREIVMEQQTSKTNLQTPIESHKIVWLYGLRIGFRVCFLVRTSRLRKDLPDNTHRFRGLPKYNCKVNQVTMRHLKSTSMGLNPELKP